MKLRTRVLVVLFLGAIASFAPNAAAAVDVESLQFYASDGTHVEYSDRTYASRFPRSSTRYVWTELTIAHPAPGAKHDVSIECEYQYPWGERLGVVTMDFELQPTWKAAYNQKSMGWAEAGKWPAGVYAVDCRQGGVRIAMKTFEIVETDAPSPATTPPASPTPPKPPPPTKDREEQPPEFDLSKLPDSGVDLAIVRANQSSLRETPSAQGSLLVPLKRAMVLALLSREPRASFYHVIEIDSGKEGWVEAADVQVRLTSNPTKGSMFQAADTGSGRDPEITILNDSDGVLTLRIGELRVTIDPKKERTFSVQQGTYRIHASTPGVIPYVGDETFEKGRAYSRRYYVVTE